MFSRKATQSGCKTESRTRNEAMEKTTPRQLAWVLLRRRPPPPQLLQPSPPQPQQQHPPQQRPHRWWCRGRSIGVTAGTPCTRSARSLLGCLWPCVGWSKRQCTIRHPRHKGDEVIARGREREKGERLKVTLPIYHVHCGTLYFLRGVRSSLNTPFTCCLENLTCPNLTYQKK